MFINVIIKIIAGLIIFIIIGIIISKIFYHDAYKLSQDDRDTATQNIYNKIYKVLDNPIKKMLVLRTTIDSKEQGVLKGTIRTLYGIKIGQMDISFGDRYTFITWEKWFNFGGYE